MAEQFHSREERRKQLNANKSKKPKAKKKSTGILKKIFLSLVALGIVGILAGVATFAYLIKDAPKLDSKLLKDPIPSKILDRNGNLITEIGSSNREYVPYNDIPMIVQDAFIATEDYRFYQHHGIDPIRLLGATLANFEHGFGSEGASTIDEQLIKNSILTPQKTIKRKVEEAWLAYQLDRTYTKHQILEMYLNKIYFSEDANGVGTAAKAYYGKSLQQLTLPEVAMLAGLPQSPNNYNPFNHPEAAQNRRNIVLHNMYNHGYITESQMQNAEKVPVTEGLVKGSQRQLNDKPYDPFIDEVINEVQKAGDFDIFTDGLTIYTTVDPKAQNYVDQLLNTNNYIDYPDSKFQAGITLLDTKTGQILAIGGGRNQQVQRGFNYAIDTQRQPGSNIKPILDYGPAIEYLNWPTYHEIDDKPITYSSGVPFHNWDNLYMGPMTIRTALALSRNSPAVQTLQQVGLQKAKTFANNLGIPLKEIYESYAIGGLSTGVSPLEMAGAYSAFGNNGFYTQPYAVTKIELRDGTVINTTPETKVVMKDSTAFMVTDMLKSVLQSPGTGVAADVPGLPIAGKTGTTNYSDQELKEYDIPSSADVPDSWFTGYTTRFTISVWTGYNSRSTPITPGYNEKIAQYLFKYLMAYESKGVNTPDFTMPKSVQEVRIIKGSMPPRVASPGTPDSQVQIEYAVKGAVTSDAASSYTPSQSTSTDTLSNANAQYSQSTNQIILSWNNDNPSSNVQYQVNVSVDGGPWQQLATTSETGIKISNPNPGSRYSFSITVLGGTSNSSVSASIDIPGSSANTNQGNSSGSQNSNQGSNTNTSPPATNPNESNTGGGTTSNNSSGSSGNSGGSAGSGTGSGNGTGTNNSSGNGTSSNTGTSNGNGTGTGNGTSTSTTGNGTSKTP